MSITTPSSPAAAVPRLDWPFLIAAVLAAAVLVALVVLDGQPASAALIIGGVWRGAPRLKKPVSVSAPRGGLPAEGEGGPQARRPPRGEGAGGWRVGGG